MALYPVAGCKIFIGGVLDEKSADFVASDFASQTWVEIKKWTQMGSIGDSAQLITADLIAETRTKKLKGTRNAGSMANVFAIDPADAGQLAVIAAEKTAFSYAVKIELNDKPSAGGSPTNSLRYFIALVTQAQEVGGGANTINNFNTMFEINSNIVRVAASAGS